MGVVADARRASEAGVVIPDSLPPVPGATVRIRDLDLVATTDEQGGFKFPNLRVADPYTKLDVEVTARGFATWEMLGAPVRPAGGLQLFVMLDAVPVTERPIPPEERADSQTAPLAIGAVSVQASPPQVILAASTSSTCTGYFSNVTPPATIRVKRTNGPVQEYNFNFYVKHVLPKEWSASWPRHALRAGAIAVRHFGWYFVQHTGRGGVADGRCYDVTDSETSQVFDPSFSDPRTDRAVDDTWDWLVYKFGEIIQANHQRTLTGDTNEPCGAGVVAYGYSVMSQYGTRQCSNLGMRWRQIVTTYYSDAVSFRLVTFRPWGTPNADGRVEVFGVRYDGALLHAWQCATCPGGWSGWDSLGGTLAGNGVPARNSDGRLEAFARWWNDGSIRHAWQVCPGCGWSTWSAFEALPGGRTTVSDPAPRRHPDDGRLEIFVVAGDGSVWNKWQLTAGGTWSGWASLGGSLDSDLTVAVNSPADNFEVFGRGTDNALVRNYWDPSLARWSGWLSLGGSLADNSSPAVGKNKDGRLEAFVRWDDGASDRSIRHIWQCSLCLPAGWSGWASMSGSWILDPVVARHDDGRLEAFAPASADPSQTATNNSAWSSWQVCPGCDWSAWSSLGGSLDSAITIGINPNGSFEIFARQPNFPDVYHRMLHNYWDAANARWSGWISLGGTF